MNVPLGVRIPHHSLINNKKMNVYDEIQAERQRQNKKWGEQNHSCLNQKLLNTENDCTPEKMCEHYEIPSENRAKFMCDIAFENGNGTYAEIAIEEMSEIVSEFDPIKRREEIIQLAAVCVAWVEKIDRDLKH